MTLMTRSNGLLPTFFDDFLGRDLFLNDELNIQHQVPAVNIIENDEGYDVEMAAPGLEKKNFEISLDNQLLTISYNSTSESDKRDMNYSQREFRFHAFKRSFTLPKSVETEKIKATYKDGILNVNIPKKEEAKQKPSRLIAIS